MNRAKVQGKMMKIFVKVRNWEMEKKKFGQNPALVKLVNGEEILIEDLIEFGWSTSHHDQEYLYGLLEKGSIEIPERSILYVIHL